ncbi:hypothetical protein BS17DRAFT_788280 [Gyrodon lividus]|nr:hypothetical protein BS17DRAFT_788280 [Gyrodon lividus]
MALIFSSSRARSKRHGLRQCDELDCIIQHAILPCLGALEVSSLKDEGSLLQAP